MKLLKRKIFKKLNRKRLLSLLLLFLFLGCEKKQTETTLFSGNAMTMDYHISIGHKMNSREVSKVAEKIDEIFQIVDHHFNKFNPESELSALNNLPVGEQMKLSPELYDLLQLCFVIQKATDQRFDPSIEAVQKKVIPRLRHSEAFDIEQVRNEEIGFSNLTLKNGLAIKKAPIVIDLSAIAKGKTVDLLVEILVKMGYQNLLVSWAGEVKAIGKHPSNRPWQVALASNKKKIDRALKIPLQNEAVATSGDHAQNWKVDGEHYCHIFNPKTKLPLKVAVGNLSSITVVTKECAVADALATAIMTAESQEVLDKLLDQIKMYYPNTQFWIMRRKELP